MNLYLLLALAFGAMSVEMPVVRASVILSREDGQGSQVARKQILRSAQDDGVARPSARPRLASAAVRFEAPLTGAATPRAPAILG
jgi:hypothetical protein